MLCLSGIIMAAFTTSLLIADLWVWRTGRIIPHIFLGGIVTALFVVLCQHGYELVNWTLLALVAITLLASLFKNMVTEPTEPTEPDDSCSCMKKSLCSCQKPKCPTRRRLCN